jgi:hypothetical protein
MSSHEYGTTDDISFSTSSGNFRSNDPNNDDAASETKLDMLRKKGLLLLLAAKTKYLLFRPVVGLFEPSDDGGKRKEMQKGAANAIRNKLQYTRTSITPGAGRLLLLEHILFVFYS